METLRLSTLAVLILGCISLVQAETTLPVTIAGNGLNSSDDNAYQPNQPRGVATEIKLGNPFGVQPSGGNLLITTVSDHCVWELNRSSGELRRIAGNGRRGYSGDGGLATDASFDWPHEVRIDDHGNLFIADTRNHVIRRVDAVSGIVSTIGGTGQAGYHGDGGQAVEARFNQPHSVVLDRAGGILVADTLNHRVRRIDLATGIVTSIAGTGEKKLPSDGSRAETSPVFGPRSLAVDSESIWIALREGNSIWRLDRASGTVHHIAGTGAKGYSRDGDSALASTFNGPKGLAIDSRGNLVVSDTENHAIRYVNLQTDQVTTLMGGRDAGDPLLRPHGVAVDEKGRVIVGDSEKHRVLEQPIKVAVP